MTLTTLRRLVFAGNALAVAAAGAAGWHSLSRAEESKPVAWDKKFVRTPAGTIASASAPAALFDDYRKAAGWPQGDKPPPPPPPEDPKSKAPPLPELKEKYDLRCVFFVADAPRFSSIMIGLKGKPSGTMGVGTMVPADPEVPDGPRLNYRLDGATLTTAVFHDLVSEEEVVLDIQVAGGGTTLGAAPGAPGPEGKTTWQRSKDAPAPLVRLLPSSNPAAGTYEYEAWAEEGSPGWFDSWSDEEVKKLSAVPRPGPEGGVVLKGVPANSMAVGIGLKQEDVVIAVNGKKVSSTSQAIDVGKKDYEAGQGTFTVQVDRKGQILNFTVHVPRKKPGK